MKLSDETVFTHNYMFVITSLPAEILSCYRLCWQVELVFKRLKSLLQLGSIPTKTEEAGEVWIDGKICCRFSLKNILGILIFPPLGTSAGNQSIWRETKLVSFIIFMMILPNIQTVSFDILELVKMSFIEKRKTVRQQILCFYKVSAYRKFPPNSLCVQKPRNTLPGFLVFSLIFCTNILHGRIVDFVKSFQKPCSEGDKKWQTVSAKMT